MSNNLSLLLPLCALLLKFAGFAFLFTAALGVLRFADPLQRMHASTKAGTIGAGLMVAGAALGNADSANITVVVVTIVFLVFTVPVAGHLLGRAIYRSGAPLQGLSQPDSLREALQVRPRPTDAGDAGKN